MHAGSQAPCSQREQATTGAHVENRLLSQVFDLQLLLQREFRLANVRLIDSLQEPRPVLAELEAQLIIDGDVAVFVGGDTGIVQSEVIRVGAPADCKQDVGSVDLG